MNEKDRLNAINEVRILASIKHANVISYREAFFDAASSSLCIVLSHADKGDLLEMINERKQSKLFFRES